MKKVLGWVKSNLLIVITMVIALVAIPVLIYFSSNWNRSIRDGVSADVSQTLSKLKQVPVAYEIPGMLTSGGEDWQSERVSPNPVINQKLETVLSRLSSESEGVRDLAQNHNREGKSLLVGGAATGEVLFPKPGDEGARVRLLTELTRARPEAYARLLQDAGAGIPPERAEVLRTLQARRTRSVQERVQGRVDQTLSDEEVAEIRELLSEARMDIYEQKADRVSFYAEPEVFDEVREWEPGETLPSLETAWAWQVEYWIVEDLVKAVSKANTDSSGLGMTAPRAPVKRILSIDVKPLGSASSGDGGGGGGRGGDASVPVSMPTDPNAVISPTFSAAFTGRAGYPVAPNALYDVRYATMTLVVDMNRIPEVINAISTTNFMSVIDLDFEAVDPHAALEDGFVYGGDAVARATLRVETIWLRDWMKPWMPSEVRERLGIPPDPEEPASEDELE